MLAQQVCQPGAPRAAQVAQHDRLPARPDADVLRNLPAQLITATPVVAAWGQRFVVRDESGLRTLGGGTILRPVSRLATAKRPLDSEALERLRPATAAAAERAAAAEGAVSTYDLAVAIYGECHEDFQEWHWEGARAELARFFALFATAADELPLPPPGAKPLAKIVQTTRRQPARHG